MPYLLTITRPDGRTAERTLTNRIAARREVIWTLTGGEFGLGFDAAREFSHALVYDTPRGVPLVNAATGLAFTVETV